MTTIAKIIEDFVKFGPVVRKLKSSSRGNPKFCGVYLLKPNKAEKIYVGSHADLYMRPVQHLHLLRHNRHWNVELQKAYNKNPSLDVLFFVTETREEAYDFEQKILDKYYDTGLLFNKAKNARLAMEGLEVSLDTRNKLSLAGKGRPHSAEHAKKISESLKGQKFTPERIAKIKAKAQSRDHTRLKAMSLVAALASAKKVFIQGIVYSSIAEAVRSLKLPSSTVRKRLSSKAERFKDWYRIE